MKCPNCQVENRAEARYCKNCGVFLPDQVAYKQWRKTAAGGSLKYPLIISLILILIVSLSIAGYHLYYEVYLPSFSDRLQLVAEMNLGTLYKSLAKNQDEQLERALQGAEEEFFETGVDFVTLFAKKLSEQGAEFGRYYSDGKQGDERKYIMFLRQKTEQALARAEEIIDERLDAYGIKGVRIEQKNVNQIITELVDVPDPGRIGAVITRTAQLEMHLLIDSEICQQLAGQINEYVQSKAGLHNMYQTVTSADVLAEQGLFLQYPYSSQEILIPMEVEGDFKQVIKTKEVQEIIWELAGDAQYLRSSATDNDGQFYEVYLVKGRPELSGEVISEAEVEPNPYDFNKFEVVLTLNEAGTRSFARITGANINKRLAVVVDQWVYMAPTIMSKISDGRLHITGFESFEEAQDLCIVLQSGPLPAPLSLISERIITQNND